MKMKKFFAAVLALALCMSLFAGCGDAKEETKVTQQESAAASAVSAAAETAEASAPAEAKSEAAPAAAEAAVSEEVTAESLLNGYYDRAADIKSISYKLLMDVQMDINLLGTEQAVTMNMDVDTETCGDNAYMKGIMTSDTYGTMETEEVEQYIMLEDGKYVAYSYDKDTDSWTKASSEKPAVSKELIPKIDASKFNLDSTGSQYKVSGAVDLKELIETMGESFGELFSGMADLDVENLTGSANVEYYFNKDTKDLEAVTIDMAEAVENIFKSMFAALFEGAEFEDDSENEVEIDASSIDIHVGSFLLKLDQMQIDQGKEIVLPEAAKNAEEGSTSDIFDIDDTDSGDSGSEENLSVELADSFDFTDAYKTFSYNGSDFVVNETLLSDFLAATGLTLEEDTEETVEADESTYAAIYLNDDYDYLSLYVRNPGAEAVSIEDCIIYGLDISVYSDETIDFSIGGLKLGATMDELMAQLGNPTYGYESEYGKTYSWESEDWDSISFSFNADSEKASSMGVSVYAW